MIALVMISYLSEDGAAKEVFIASLRYEIVTFMLTLHNFALFLVFSATNMHCFLNLQHTSGIINGSLCSSVEYEVK